MGRKRPGYFISDSMTSEISRAAPVTNMASVYLRVEEERKRRGSFPVSGLEQLLRSLTANEVVSVSHIPFFLSLPSFRQ